MKKSSYRALACFSTLMVLGGCSVGGEYGGTANYLLVKDIHSEAGSGGYEAVGYLLSDEQADRFAAMLGRDEPVPAIRKALESSGTRDYDSPVVPLRDGNNAVMAGDYQMVVLCGRHFTPLTRVSIDRSVAELDLTCKGTGYKVKM